MAPPEPQSYRLNKLSWVEAFFLDEIEIREQGLIKSTVITGGISIAAFANGAGLSVGIALSGTSLLLSLATAITRKPFKIFTKKQEKHDATKLLAQTILDSTSNIISQAMQAEDISHTEFQKVLQEVEKYRKHKPDIRNQTKAKVRKEGKEDSLRKITNSSGTQGANTIQNMKPLCPTACDFMVYKDYKNRFKTNISNM